MAIKINTYTKKILLFVFLLISLVYFYYRIQYTIPIEQGWMPLILNLVLLLMEITAFTYYLCTFVILKDIDINTVKTPVLKNDVKYPDVDIFIPVFDEDMETVKKAIYCCKNMRYSEKDKIHIYVCDDSQNKEIEEISKELNVNYLKRVVNAYGKSGCLNNALKQSNSPYIVIFNANIMPMSDFLLKTIPFFIEEGDIGFVQTPIHYYNTNILQYNLRSDRIGFKEEEFFRVLQSAKSNRNSVIYSGTNVAISRKALNDIGGFAFGSFLEEDITTGILIQNLNYKCVYLNEIHASGTGPATISDYFNKCVLETRNIVRTTLDIKLNKTKKINIFQKFEYLHYLLKSNFVFYKMYLYFLPILFSVFNIKIIDIKNSAFIFLWLIMYFSLILTNKYLNNNTSTLKEKSIIETIKLPYVIKGIIFELLEINNKNINPKSKDELINKVKFVWTQELMLILSFVGLIKLSTLIYENGFNINYLVIIAWLINNIYFLWKSIIFVSGRTNYRAKERYKIKAKTELMSNDGYWEGYTYDISESGISVVFNEKPDIECNDIFNIKMKLGLCTVQCLARGIYFSQFKDQFKYAFKIIDIDSKNMQELIFMLYDKK